MAQTTVDGVQGVLGLVGQHLGYTEWTAITQEQVNTFADATGDHQWIHVDVERANRESPFGGPIAHGYLTLSLVSAMLPEIVEMTGFRMGVNYGTEKVRFPSPVPVGAKLRYGATLDSATEFDGGIQTVLTVTAEVEGASKPSMVATVVLRRYL
jgi:acyl dehydratase